ncbi:hypothetical protein J6590_088016 [Homalodisca vitripennis]|nr:hypothetical protein J6590_088016 [Homalodisca vitripennis]
MGGEVVTVIWLLDHLTFVTHMKWERDRYRDPASRSSDKRIHFCNNILENAVPQCSIRTLSECKSCAGSGRGDRYRDPASRSLKKRIQLCNSILENAVLECSIRALAECKSCAGSGKGDRYRESLSENESTFVTTHVFIPVTLSYWLNVVGMRDKKTQSFI